MDSKIARVAIGVVGASALVVGLAACSSAEPSAATVDDSESSTAAPDSAVDSDGDGTLDEFDYAPGDADVQRQEDTESAAPAPTTPAPTPATPAPAPVAPVEQPATVTVPDVTGMNYQDAQDQLRASGLVVYPATDGLGANRIPVLDANWYVVSQDIEPGTSVDSGTGVTCTVLKYTDN